MSDDKSKKNSKNPAPKGRPTKLTPEVIQKLRQAMLTGVDLGTAAAYVGIKVETYRNWLKRGRNKGDGLYGELIRTIERAHAEVQIKDLMTIDAFSVGVKAEYLMRPAKDNQGKVQYDRQGNVILEPVVDENGRYIKIKSEAKRDWRAAAFRLERKYAQWRNKEETIHSGQVGTVNLTLPDNGRSVNSKRRKP